MPGPSDNLKPILDWLERDTGLALSKNREAAALLGVERVMESAGIAGTFEFLGQLKVDKELRKRVISQLTIGETYFFRDAGQFEFIKKHIIPSWKQSTQRRSVWSAGCSTGEEPYSLAIVFEEQGFGRRVDLLATDISEESLEMARLGVYRNWSLRGLTPKSLGRFVESQGNVHRITDDIKFRVKFSSLNLAHLRFPSAARGLAELDLILCRNVLIYLRPEVIEQVISHMFDSLAPGGWLILGATDPQVGGHAAWQVESTTSGVFYRRPLERTSTSGAFQNESLFRTEPAGDGASGRVPSPAGSALNDAPTANQPPPRGKPVLVESPSLARTGSTEMAATTSDFSDVNRVKELSNQDAEAAVVLCEKLISTRLTDPELHHLHAVLLLGLDRLDAAATAIRRSLFLDSTLAMAHFTNGMIEQRRRRTKDAIRSFNTASKILNHNFKPSEIVPLSDGITAGELTAAVRDSLVQLEAEINE